MINQHLSHSSDHLAQPLHQLPTDDNAFMDSGGGDLTWLDLMPSSAHSTLERNNANPQLRVIQSHSSLQTVFPGQQADQSTADPLSQFSIPLAPHDFQFRFCS